MADERRQAERIRARYKVRFWNDEIDGLGFSDNVSNTGLFVETRAPPPVGTRLHVEISLGDQPFNTECEVARIRKVAQSVASVSSSGMGLRVISWPEAWNPDGWAAAREGSDPTLDLRSPTRLRTAIDNHLSRGALFLPGALDRSIGEEVTVMLLLPEPLERMSIVGQVVHLSEKPPGAGLIVGDASAICEQLMPLVATGADGPLVVDRQVAVGDRFEVIVEAPAGRLAVKGVVQEVAAAATNAIGSSPRFISPAPTAVANDDAILDLSDPARLKTVFDAEISHGGVFVTTTKAAEMGDVITILVRLPHPHEAIPAAGTVVYRSTEPPGLGLQLSDNDVLKAALETAIG